MSSPTPLVVMLHRGFGTAQQAEKTYDWDELADSATFVVIYPDGVGRAWNVGAHLAVDPARIRRRSPPAVR